LLLRLVLKDNLPVDSIVHLGSFKALGFRGQLVVLGGEKIVGVANGLEEDV